MYATQGGRYRSRTHSTHTQSTHAHTHTRKAHTHTITDTRRCVKCTCSPSLRCDAHDGVSVLICTHICTSCASVALPARSYVYLCMNVCYVCVYVWLYRCMDMYAHVCLYSNVYLLRPYVGVCLLRLFCAPLRVCYAVYVCMDGWMYV